MVQLDLVGSLRDLNVLSVGVRLLLAMVFGGTIGFERGVRQRAAGLRTHMLLCVGAASTMLVSQFIYASYGVGDPARLSAQVISGIGFLGAGTIIVTRRNQVKGLTTAATLWATACMGLAVGVGFYECALIMYVILIFILLLVNVVDTKFLKVPTSTASVSYTHLDVYKRQHYYKGLFALVLVCIVVSAVSTVIGSAFPQTLVDDYIVPMINSGSQDFSGLFQAIVRLVGILAVGVVAIFAYNRIMVNISQGTMRHLRDDLFHKMESLPIKYFDTHAHGDIMSVYTNDVDTLRQMISQSIPQIINTVITMIATLITMLVLNPVLTIIPVSYTHLDVYKRQPCRLHPHL